MSELATDPTFSSGCRRGRLPFSFVVVLVTLLVVLALVVVVAPSGTFPFCFSFLLRLMLLLLVVVAVVVVVVVVVVSFSFTFLSSPFSFLAIARVASDVVDVLVAVADGLTWEARVAVGEEVADHLTYLRPGMMWSNLK